MTSGPKHAAELIPAKGFKANLREDTGEVLGIVSDEYEVVDNRDAFRFLDALIGSELYFETAGSLWGGRRVWVLARLPESIELGGDQSATYVYVANSHDGSMAVTAAATPIRIVCANTLGAALRQSEHGVHAERTFRFRHTGNLQAKFAEARQVLGMTINYQTQFKALADRLALEPISDGTLERRVLRHLWVTDDENLGRRRAARTASGRSSTCSPSSAGAASPATPRATAPAPSGSAFNASPSTSIIRSLTLCAVDRWCCVLVGRRSCWTSDNRVSPNGSSGGRPRSIPRRPVGAWGAVGRGRGSSACGCRAGRSR